MNTYFKYVLIYIAFLSFSCKTKTCDSNVPEISFKNFDKSVIEECSPASQGTCDSLIMYITFTDCDADIGFPKGDKNNDLFVTDSRTDSVTVFKIPYVNPEKGIKELTGEIRVRIPTMTCRPIGLSFDTVAYTIQIMDRAGNMSNKIITPDILINCN